MKKQNDCDPILVKGFSRKERITFYVQGHSARTLRTYMSWAYKKMHRFPESKPKPAQDVKLRALMKKSNTRENIFRFMMLMTKKQLLTVGY